MGIFLKKIVCSISIIVLFFLILTSVFGCAKNPEFSDLTISASINKETSEPADIKNSFDFDVKKIYSIIQVKNIKGDDNYRFLWKDIESDTIVNDITGKYAQGESGLLEGFFPVSATVKEGFEYLFEPGSYAVEFYHNGELKSSADFKINKPVAKITKVSLANQVSESSEPLNPTQQFFGYETIYACAEIDYLVIGDVLNAKWLDLNNELIIEYPVNIEQYYFAPSWVSFSFFGSESDPIPQGIYNVEIYLNNDLYGTFPFEVIGEAAAVENPAFSQNNLFADAKSKYGFAMAYPDNFSYDWQEEEGVEMTVSFFPDDPDMAVAFFMAVLMSDFPTTSAEIDLFIEDEIAKDISEGVQYSGTTINESVMTDGTPFREYIYYLTDEEIGEFGTILTTFILNDKMYVWGGVSHESFYELFDSIYYTAFDSLTFYR